MKVAVEDKQNNIKFYRFDGKYKNKFIEKAKRDIKDLREIWSYEKIEDGFFVNQKVIYKNNK